MRLILLGAAAAISLTAGAALSFQAIRSPDSDRLTLQNAGSPTNVLFVESAEELKSAARIAPPTTPEQIISAAHQYDFGPGPQSQTEVDPEKDVSNARAEITPVILPTSLSDPASEAPIDKVSRDAETSVSKRAGRLVIEHASAVVHLPKKPAKVADKAVPVASPAEPARDVTEALLQRSNR